MQTSLKRVVFGASFFLFTIVASVSGYMLFGWSFLDALYMVVITVFGVGFGEVKPIETPALKIFTMVVIVAGTSSAVYIVGSFLQMVTEGEIQKVLEARRMTKGIESLEQHVIICGFGRIGQILARKLTESEQKFVVIDNDEGRMASAEKRGYLALQGNATDEGILIAAGVKQARVLATVLPDDALNVFITLTTRELNPEVEIIARGELPSTEKKLRLAGANHVVLPASIGAERMAQTIVNPHALDFLREDAGRQDLSDLLAQIDIQLEELTLAAGSPFIGKPLSSMEVRGKGAFVVVAIRKEDGEIVTHPSHDRILHQGDTVILMGHRGDIPKFAQRYAMKRQMYYRGMSY
ncbi:potassium channel protein [Tumidithrix elongata RA019]|uniref:Potassium channel protein n=1 Tax=Tumidithrix elongata BACA0141 TaxID=2716417 RepID=A0AAW9PUT5_9CYAN|nr:potassium channel protein [Tumidithrix elongata RA019]